jgi:hypothetical protein
MLLLKWLSTASTFAWYESSISEMLGRELASQEACETAQLFAEAMNADQ